MEIVIKYKDIAQTINLDSNCILFGANSTYKNNFIKNIKDGLSGKSKNIFIDGKYINLKNYNVIILDEDNDFANEFKFTKSNTLKKIIYDDIIDKLNEEKIVNYTNEIFDVIDDKVNKLLDRKVNKKSDTNVSFQIEIPDINSIIDKFTNIYIDDILLSNSEVSKSMKRKLLYQLYFWEIENQIDNDYIVFLDNFDAYLNTDEIISIINKICKLSNNNCHFILTTCSNIFEYIPQDIFSIYKVIDKVIPFDIIDIAIKDFLIRREYNKVKNISFDKYYQDNESLISKEEILNIKNKILNKYPHLISKVLNCSTIKIVNSRPKKINCEYIICENKELEELFVEICSKMID